VQTVAAPNNPKRHHYIPTSYLERFCNAEGGFLAYHKDRPSEPKPLTPENVGHRRYYYSQPTETGRDHNSFETFFSQQLESKWPALVDDMLARKALAPEQISHLVNFIAGQYARVPCTRDALEYLHAERLKLELHHRVATGEIAAPPPEVLELFREKGIDNPFDGLEFSIDPHMSLRGIPETLRHVEDVFEKSTFFLLHNTSGAPFLTSDNPVAWFDPTVSPEHLLPYVHMPDGHVLLLFPVTPWLIVFGGTGYDTGDWNHIDLPDPRSVATINETICRFAYEWVFAQSRDFGALIERHAALSPVMSTRATVAPDGTPVMHWHWVFGERRKKPKWVEPTP
jgi:hypothetical protein